MHFVLTENNSVANDFLMQLRDVELQRDRMRFRKNLERLGAIMAYEISRHLAYKTRMVTTPLGSLNINTLAEQPVLLAILRAGLPYLQGFIDFFDKADCGFIGAYRQEDAHHVTIKLSYLATNSLNDKIVLLIDPMLATGRSIIDTVNAIMRNGIPKHVHVVSLVSAPEGLAFLNENIKIPYSTWTCAIDEKLDENFYIVPGLGDAGDLSYGIKL